MTTVDGQRPDDALETRVEQLEARLRELESIELVKKLQLAYGYYVDYCLWDEITDLFADDGVVEISNNGVYRGRAHIGAFYLDHLGGGRHGRPRGHLHNHMQLQGVVDVAADGRSAQGRWREITLIAATDPTGAPLNIWAEGVYENEYVSEGGTWKIKTLRWLPSFSGRLADEAFNTRSWLPPLGEPDEPSTFGEQTLLDRMVPFHYRHPVTAAVVDVASATGAPDARQDKS